MSRLMLIHNDQDTRDIEETELILTKVGFIVNAITHSLSESNVGLLEHIRGDGERLNSNNRMIRCVVEHELIRRYGGRV